MLDLTKAGTCLMGTNLPEYLQDWSKRMSWTCIPPAQMCVTALLRPLSENAEQQVKPLTSPFCIAQHPELLFPVRTNIALMLLTSTKESARRIHLQVQIINVRTNPRTVQTCCNGSRSAAHIAHTADPMCVLENIPQSHPTRECFLR